MKADMFSFKIWSNAFYLIPIVYAVQHNVWLTAGLAACVVTFGTLYHLSQEKRFFWADSIAAYLLIAANLYICYLGNFQAPYFWVALLFVFLAFLYHFYLQNRKIGQYDFNHGMWHLYGALITLFCLFTFVL